MSRVVQLPSRGQITIPAEFRRLLGLDEGDLLRLTLKEGRIEIEPLAVGEDEQLRQYTEAELRQFMEEDRIDAETAETVRALLAAGVL
jgi:AbrB family looped-hinge helix DNA binding protein